MPTSSDSPPSALRHAAAAAVVLVTASALVAFPLAAQDSAASTSPVARQLDVGEQWFRASCAECHVTSLGDSDFRFKWNGRTAYDLFAIIRSTMPEHEPGSLSLPTYSSIVAYLMKINGMPVASVIPSDSAGLSTVKLTFTPTLR
jgi:mono/diheme cytochrome c family protein